jgi:EAL domain-containing protein (putative c-di-GMP-specific phosphodiesterase class I)
MHRAKSSGRNRYEVFNEDIRQVAVERLDIENSLRWGIDRGQLRLLYQPQVDLATGVIVGYEALVRWQHPERGVLMPDQFIKIAEECGLITSVGHWVLQEACHEAARWQGLGPHGEHPRIAVNMSPYELAQRGLSQAIRRTLDESGLDPHLLCIEVTESAMMDASETTLDTLRAIRELGIQLAIDDFGTGFSALSYLKRFSPDFLKVDRSFVAGLCKEVEDTAIVTAMVRLCQGVGVTTIAEGVETEEQLSYLRSLDCEWGQGYLFSRPIPATEVRGRLIPEAVAR